MRHPLFILLAALSLSTAALAQPTHYPTLTLTDGTRYRGATVTTIQPDGLRITHSEGVAKMPYEALPAASLDTSSSPKTTKPSPPSTHTDQKASCSVRRAATA